MALETAAGRQAMRRKAYRYSSLLQRRIYDEITAAFCAGPDGPADAIAAARRALDKVKIGDIDV